MRGELGELRNMICIKNGDLASTQQTRPPCTYPEADLSAPTVGELEEEENILQDA